MPQSQPDSATAPGAATPWYAEGLRFTCTRCGKCCGGPPGYVWVDQGDIRAIAAKLGLVKKLAREKARATSIRVPQLKDCKIHRKPSGKPQGESMIFLAEGQSAAGSIVSCRDPNTQAIFTLKGKPLNVCDLNRDRDRSAER